MKKQFNPKNFDIRTNYHLMISGISPRPIAFVSSISSEKDVNLAPYSFFNGFGANPPIVGFSPGFEWKNWKAERYIVKYTRYKRIYHLNCKFKNGWSSKFIIL